jgi:EAL domain-containing protein (putative c-di-GMP-specific phosphodiesterase class I)
VSTGRPVALEALVRGDLGGHALVPPKRFMPLIADSGLHMELLRRTLQLVCAQGRVWREAKFRPIKVAINLSAEQLDHAGLCPVIDSVMKEALPDIPWLELELPRSAALGDNSRAARVLAQLKQRGFPLVLDNYGCGQAELEALAGLPIDKIKIDGSITRRIGKDPTAAKVIRQALELRSSLAITLLAAGVETKGEYRLLTEWGCHLVQGNLLSPAMPPERIAAAVFARPTDKEVEP